MNETESKERTTNLVLEYEIDAPPEKVWKAISVQEIREQWLPENALADAEPVSCEPGAEVRYRMKENEPPFLESLVTFQITPNAGGSTTLRIIHGLVDARLAPQPAKAANNNGPCLMLAA